MLTDKLKRSFLLLLRQGLWGREESTEGLFPLTPNEWTDIFDMSCKQTVQGILYDGISLLPAELCPPRNMMERLSIGIDAIERTNHKHQMVREFVRQEYFGQPAIPFVLIKGLNVATFYRKPQHRLAGDIDLWFGNEAQTENAIKRMERLGLPVNRGQNGESACLVGGVVVEHHSYLIDLHSPFLRNRLRLYEKQTFNESKETLPPVANHLLLSTHILKHLINEGIGMRQLCDVAMALSVFTDPIERKELERISRKWHILRWNKLLYSLLVKYLGLPAECLPFSANVNPDGLMNEVWQSGNFGQGDERYGERPKGKWANKRYTINRVAHKLNLSLGYAADETFWWLAGLCRTRVKELLTQK